MDEFSSQLGEQISTMVRKHGRGFTLVELALVIVLIGIFSGLGLGILNTLQAKNAFDQTRRKQEKITNALVIYFSNNQRLPCPDTNPVAGAPSTGRENRTTPADPNSPCSDPAGVPITPAIGVVPFAALGISRDDALDGWDNFFTYQVSLETGVRPENENWSVTPATGSITASVGSIRLDTRDAAGVSVTVNNPGIGQGNLAVIISHGPNGLGAYTTKGTRNVPPPGADELDNTDGNSLFYQRQYTEVAGPGGTFDDLVRGFTTIDILSPVIRDGALQSATAQVRAQLRTIRDTAFGQVPVDPPGPPCFPPSTLVALGLPGTVTVDPWGNPINYLGATAQLTTSTPPAGTDAFCVWSFGPNGANDSGGGAAPPCPAIAGDDVGLASVTYGQLRSAYPAAVCP